MSRRRDSSSSRYRGRGGARTRSVSRNFRQEKRENQMRERDALASEMEAELAKLRIGSSHVRKDQYTLEKVTRKSYLERLKNESKKFLGANIQVGDVYEVSNPFLKKKWLEARKRMFEPLHHHNRFLVIDERTAKDILKDGFKVMVGSAPGSSKTLGEGVVMLYCDVLSGQSYTLTDEVLSKRALKEEEFDSMYFSKMIKSVPDAVVIARHVLYDPYLILATHLVYLKTAKVKPKERYSVYESDSGSDSDMPLSAISSLPTIVTTSDILEMEALKFSSGTTCHRLRAKRAFDSTNPLDMNYRIVESQFHRFQKEMSSKYEIEAVDYHINPTLVRDFFKQKKEFEDKYGKDNEKSNYVLAFHGTQSGNIPSILENNFDLDKRCRGLYGQGIYLSEFPDVSMGYSLGSRSLLLCKVLPGNSFDLRQTMSGAMLMPGYDSHRVKPNHAGYGWALVLFNSKQILPCYVVHYKSA